MHEDNSFITLTYTDSNLKSPRLQYEDFQLFMKKLRHTTPNAVPMVVTGEYGDLNKRPHWHAITFNWSPGDLEKKYTNENGDQVYSSNKLEELWQLGMTELGSVTFQSAGYVCRYAAKKLIHGKDAEHDFHPIHKMSSKYAIGKTFLEKYHEDIFSKGYIVLDNGTKTAIPRYYEKWLKDKHPDKWEAYVTQIKLQKMYEANLKQEKEKREENFTNHKRLDQGKNTLQITKNEQRKKITDERFKRLQSYLKGDI